MGVLHTYIAHTVKLVKVPHAYTVRKTEPQRSLEWARATMVGKPQDGCFTFLL